MYVVWFFDYRYRIELEYNRTYCRFDFSIIDIVSNSNIVSNSIVVSNSTIALNSIIVSNSIYRSTSIRCVLWQEVTPNILRLPTQGALYRIALSFWLFDYRYRIELEYRIELDCCVELDYRIELYYRIELDLSFDIHQMRAMAGGST